MLSAISRAPAVSSGVSSLIQLLHLVGERARVSIDSGRVVSPLINGEILALDAFSIQAHAGTSRLAALRERLTRRDHLVELASQIADFVA